MNRRLRIALIAGLGGMLGIFAVAGWESVRLLAAMRAENQELQNAARLRSRKLASIRTSILVSQQWLGQNGDSAARVRDSWTRTMAELADYPPAGDDDAALFRRLHGMLENHWSRLDRALSEAPPSSQAAPSDTAGPLRIAALEITTQLDDVDARQAAATGLAIRNQFEGLGRGLALSLNFALVAALLLAIGCAVYVLRIERLNRARFEELRRARAALVDAQETERTTISRELHDQVGQTLNAVLVDAANLARRIPQNDTVSRGYLDNIRSYADSSVNSIRDIALLLRPSMLDDLGLIPALEWQAREVSRRTGIDVRVSAEGVADSLPDAVRTCVYRVVQEALQNVSRHSGARHARVTVKQAPDGLTLAVEDDGAGFDPARTRGMGLLGMEERVRQLGGRLEVKSAPGKGAAVAVALALTE
jgi:signal transduction histidine kinase